LIPKQPLIYLVSKLVVIFWVMGYSGSVKTSIGCFGTGGWFMTVFGVARVSTLKQSLKRQITNIKAVYPDAVIIKEYYTGTTSNRPEWVKLKKTIKSGQKIVFDSVSRMSRNLEEGFQDYQELFNRNVELVFLKEPHINTSVYRQSLNNAINLEISTGNNAVDEYFNGNIDLINRLVMKLAQEQIRIAFEQSEKEIKDLHQRIREGIRESNKPIGLKKGTKLDTKKAKLCREIITQRLNLVDSGELTDAELIKLCDCSRNSYYKYKKQVKSNLSKINQPK
jgi:DNA invertase Pin-like site-specific DNA recombinase